MSEIDLAIGQAVELLQAHCELYRKQIVCEPGDWNRRAKELAENLNWLIFCREQRLPRAPKVPPPKYPPPPRVAR
ncbi:hypothetical protein IVB38_14265 [Bradyrhizobium sp. 38]|uniref:hypothetical protein n=1 Tax=unclassified Bradyrhizobium TaxID=2631580 RepID=UPI001FF90308|nr:MULTISPECIES: hypothetical protein [unclassified Bradyrhizobium]MCK1337161.1 hypothetical protein [Bradyrhizobium sp. 38]MCK1778273.1 hypothetical protein [Bradyrhizobium sp. 132]